MTKQELTDYCIKYWQYTSKKMLGIMKDYPCVYIDKRICSHSLTFGEDTDAICVIEINPECDDIFLYSLDYKFRYDHVEKNGHIYRYDEIEDNVINRFIGMVLYISNHYDKIMDRMQNELDLINHLKRVVGK